MIDMIKNINYPLILSISKRDLRLYFSNPTGYVFITLFIFLSAAAAFWQERFFLNNLANLNLLNDLFPLILIFFVPALTMGVWSDEKKQGTDELLFTLPGTDLEIVVGKYLAVLGMYTASLILSVSHVFVLFWLGSPDLGLMFGNYLGFWLIGASFIAVGMLASLLSSNATISFITGVVFCAFIAYLDSVFSIFGSTVERLFESLTVFDYFADFSRGVVSFSGMLYFLSLASMAIYVNIILVGKRHWPLKADGYHMGFHHSVRIGALLIAVISLNAILGRMSIRLDVTAEQLHSLSNQTQKLIDEIDDDRTVFIQAYISQEVPQPMVQTRENLVGYLKEIDAIGGSKVEVLIHNTEPFTAEAQEAREKFGISARQVLEPGSGRTKTAQVFMGVAFTSGAEEQVIPFFDRGLPVEYELARSIRVVAKTDRKKIGIINTQLNLFGGFDYQTMQSLPSWQVVEELKKQYEVVQIAPTEPIVEDLDGLLVALPSSLPQEGMDNLITTIESGIPTLLLVDPIPYVNPGLSPLQQSGANQNPFMRGQGPQPPPKGDINGFMNRLGVLWNASQIVWDAYNPHPSMAQLPPEFVFVGAANQKAQSFNNENNVSSGLQEMIMLFAGNLRQTSDSPYTFEPLIKSGTVSGLQNYHSMMRNSFFGPQLVFQGLPHRPDPSDYVMAAQIRSQNIDADSASASSGAKVNAIVIADIDFISEQFFQIRSQGFEGLNFDNVNFFLNAMDALVGDESFVDLRKRRVRHRTLKSVEARTQEYIAKRAAEEQQAETEAQIALAQAQQRLNQKVAEVRQRTDVDENTKEIMARNLQEAENKRFNALKSSIESEKEMKVQASKEDMESQLRVIQNNIKIMAVLLPPIPVLVLGIMIFVKRRRREDEGATTARRLRS